MQRGCLSRDIKEQNVSSTIDEHNHLEPSRRTVENNCCRSRAQAKENVLGSHTLQQGRSPISQEVERELVEAMPATQLTQPARRKRRLFRQQDHNATQSTVITRAQSRKVASEGGEVNRNSNISATVSKTTASKTTRRNGIGNTGVIGGKVDSRKSRRTDGT